jgi:hypothetical protein
MLVLLDSSKGWGDPRPDYRLQGTPAVPDLFLAGFSASPASPEAEPIAEHEAVKRLVVPSTSTPLQGWTWMFPLSSGLVIRSSGNQSLASQKSRARVNPPVGSTNMNEARSGCDALAPSP